MKSLSLVAAATLVTLAAANPVCIVGAGPAGLTIANKLQAKGLETVIFEKNPEVGGKCQAYYDELQVTQFEALTSDACELMSSQTVTEVSFTLWAHFSFPTRPTVRRCL
jgi:flavin-dependent dehydrogenase